MEAPSSIMEQLASNRGRLAMAAALGTGVVLGAAGLVVYQRMSQNVGLRVTGSDFSQELATLTTHIEALRADIEQLKAREGLELDQGAGGGAPHLKSALKKGSLYQSDQCLVTSESGDMLELPELGLSRKRNLSWGSGLTNGSASSSGTEYFSALSGSDEEDNLVEGIVFQSAPNNKTEFGYEESRLVETMARMDDLMEGSREQQKLALEQLKKSVEEQPNNPSLMWRLCKAQYLCSVLANQDGDKEEQKKLILKAVEAGETALALDSKNSEAHKWFAIALGSRGEFGGVKEKIMDGFEFKKHIDKAAELNPRDHVTQHLLGRFCYEVSQLSWMERKMASTLFAAPPTASLPEAVQHFLQAERLKPEGWKENRLFLAKCQIGLNDYSGAVSWLDKANTIPMAGPHVREGVKDKLSQKEVDEMLSKYGRYRSEVQNVPVQKKMRTQ